MEARVSGTHFPLETLGPGRRLGIWFQGCPLACAGCMSRHTWGVDGGMRQEVSDLLAVWEAALGRGAEGLTVSGGEPLAQPEALAGLLAGAARSREGTRTGKSTPGNASESSPEDGPDLLVYTGYEPGELTSRHWRALRHADAVITGRFRVERPTRLVWRGSDNQRLWPLTPRGHARYAPHLSRENPGAGLQLVVETGPQVPAVRVYGVPLQGELRETERLLKQAGITLRDPSWRP